jgi:biotin operon repressor
MSVTFNSTQQRIMNILVNENDFVTAKEFKRRIGISPRALRTEVADLRQQGIVIDSGNYGYKLAKNRREADRCIARLRATAYSILDVTDAMNKNKASLPCDEVME